MIELIKGVTKSKCFKVCECGHEVYEWQNYCSNCGVKLDFEGVEDDEKRTRNKETD